MSIRRTGGLPADHYAIVPNSWMRDVTLSWKARGLLAHLLTHREGWETSLEQLTQSGPDGRDAVRTGLRELEDAGYLIRTRQRDDTGRLAGTDYELADPNQRITPASDNPTVGHPAQADPTPKKNSSSEDQKTEDQGSFPLLAESDLPVKADPFDEWYEAYPRKAAPADARKAYRAALKRGATPEQLLTAVRSWPFPAKPKTRGVDDFRPYPASWLNRERYLDELDTPTEQTPEQAAKARRRAQGGVTW